MWYKQSLNTVHHVFGETEPMSFKFYKIYSVFLLVEQIIHFDSHVWGMQSTSRRTAELGQMADWIWFGRTGLVALVRVNASSLTWHQATISRSGNFWSSCVTQLCVWGWRWSPDLSSRCVLWIIYSVHKVGLSPGLWLVRRCWGVQLQTKGLY